MGLVELGGRVATLWVMGCIGLVNRFLGLYMQIPTPAALPLVSEPLLLCDPMTLLGGHLLLELPA